MRYHWNSSERLPPVDCPLLIRVKGRVVRAVRTGFIRKKTDEMEYRTKGGRIIVGRFEWTYP